MEFLQVVGQRRSVRQFRPEPVDRAEIERLIGMAVLAPSATNLQPWAFAVITDRARIDECARHAKEHLLRDAQVTGQVRSMLSDPQLSVFYHAPALVIVLARDDTPQAREDSCLAAYTFMLAARDAGLGTCWIGFGRPWLDLPGSKTELGIPRDAHVVAPIALGYPAAWPEPHGRRAPEIYWLTPSCGHAAGPFPAISRECRP
jgi:nitroreductase